MDSIERITRGPVADVAVLFVVLLAIYWLSRNAQSELFQIPSYLVLVFVSLLDSLLLGLPGRADIRVVLGGCLLLLAIGFGISTYRIRA